MVLSLAKGVAAALLLMAATACALPPETAAPAATVTPPPDGAPIPPTASPFSALPEPVQKVMDQPFTGDLDALVKRRLIRVAVTYNRTHYFVDEGQERGLTYEALKSFEEDLNTRLKTGNLKVNVVPLPMSRDQLYPALASGKVDMVAAMVTVTPEREKLVAFSTPTRTNVSEVVVTGPGAPADRHPRRSRRPGSLRPQGQHLRREHRRPEQAIAGARQAAGRDHGRP